MHAGKDPLSDKGYTAQGRSSEVGGFDVVVDEPFKEPEVTTSPPAPTPPAASAPAVTAPAPELMC